MPLEINVTSWEEFETKLGEIRRLQASNKKLDPTLLFRGQAQSSWRLATTLERYGQLGFPMLKYLRLISSVRPEIEAFTEHRWKIPEDEEFRAMAIDYDTISRKMMVREMPAQEYMAHIRHHGFPSPLLDWTRSVYVAAYFAFSAPGDAAVSIYALSEATMHSGGEGIPQIGRFGLGIKTHRRHFLQQSEYTACMIFSDGEWRFVEHDGAFDDYNADDEYPCNFLLYKFNIPSAERPKVLKALDEHNLNAFSLFGSEESLMETLALRKLYLS